MNGLGSMTPASPSASVCRRVSRLPGICFVLLPLQLSSAARCRALGAGLEPFCDLGEWRHVDLSWPRPGKNARHVEVGNGEIHPEQVGAVGESTVEHLQGLRELLLGRIGSFGVALVLSKNSPVE